MSRWTRRRFIGRSLASMGAIGAAAKMARTSSALTAAVTSAAPGANERVRLAIIGVGGQGRTDMKAFLRQRRWDVRVPLICDVDDAMLAEAIKVLEGKGHRRPDTVKDFRRVIDRRDEWDVLLVATPDHWHPLPMIYACQAGKDVYCEKPAANSIGESKVMLDAARKYDRVVQIGTQWKASAYFAEAVNYVHSGKLGRVRHVRCWTSLNWFGGVGNVPDSDPPPGVDYDMWLGPAPKRPFNRARFHFTFRWFWDYAGGLMTDWGVHLLNIALWAMKVDFPKRVSSSGGKYVFDDIAETPDTQSTLYDFGHFTLIWEHQAGINHGPEGKPHGVAFYGTNGTLVIGLDGWEVLPEPPRPKQGRGKLLPLEPIEAVRRPVDLKAEPELGRGKLVENFLECVQSRKRPVMDIERGHHVTTVAHLGNLALRTGRSIEYDAVNMRVLGNEQADRMITNPYRAPWKLPEL